MDPPLPNPNQNFVATPLLTPTSSAQQPSRNHRQRPSQSIENKPTTPRTAPSQNNSTFQPRPAAARPPVWQNSRKGSWAHRHIATRHAAKAPLFAAARRCSPLRRAVPSRVAPSRWDACNPPRRAAFVTTPDDPTNRRAARFPGPLPGDENTPAPRRRRRRSAMIVSLALPAPFRRRCCSPVLSIARTIAAATGTAAATVLGAAAAIK